MKIFVRKHSRWPGPLRLTLAWRRQLLGARQPHQSVSSCGTWDGSGWRTYQPFMSSPWDSPQMQHVAVSPSGEARRLGFAFAAGSMPSTAPAPRRNAIVVCPSSGPVPQLPSTKLYNPPPLSRNENQTLPGSEAGKEVQNRATGGRTVTGVVCTAAQTLRHAFSERLAAEEA